MKPKITENQLDTIFANVLETSELAARTVFKAVAPAKAQLDFDRITVRQQVRHRNTHGTADLVLHVWKGEKLQALVLIENKIDAGFTPDQPQRYRISRDAHIADRVAPLVATLLLSPSIYIGGSRLKDVFDGTLTYEAILPLVREDDRPMVEAAIERASSPYEPVPVRAVMSFFDGYAQIVANAYPDLRIKANPNSGNARPEASRTIYFDTRASGFRSYPFLLKDSKPASIRVSHQCWDSNAPSASVKLMLDGWAVHLTKAIPILQPTLQRNELYIRSAGRSLAIVADTARLDNMRSASAQQQAIEQALKKLQVIRETWNGLEAALTKAAKACGR